MVAFLSSLSSLTAMRVTLTMEAPSTIHDERRPRGPVVLD
jgi:hypothetical protein